MILDLLIKDFKEQNEVNKKRRIIKIISSLFLCALFIALETFIFISVNKKIKEFSIGSNYGFLVLFLLLVALLAIFSSLNKAYRFLFNEKDILLLSYRPLVKDDLIIAKFLMIYLSETATLFLFSFPLFISYGINNIYIASYYVLSALYPFFASLITSALTFILLIPYKYFIDYLKKHYLLQILISAVIVIILCYLYQFVLNLFLNIINNSKLDYLFNQDFIAFLDSLSKYAFPLSSLLDVFIKQDNLLSSLAIYLGMTMILLTLAFILIEAFYHLYLTDSKEKKKKQIVNKVKKDSIFVSLIKKELILVFRGSNDLSSYVSLLIMQPFFTYVVISSLTSLLYVNMEMLLTYYPELINALNITLILLFSSVIASQSMDALKREGKGLIVSKTIPISPIYQCLIKILIPSCISSLSLIISLIILISSNNISLNVFFVSLFLGLVFIISLNLIGLYDNIRILKSRNPSSKSSLSSFYGLALPLILAFIHFALTFLKIKAWEIYLIESALFSALLITLILLFKRIVLRGYLDIGGELL